MVDGQELGSGYGRRSEAGPWSDGGGGGRMVREITWRARGGLSLVCSPTFMTLVLHCTELEWKISESGAIKTDLEENPRKQIQDQLMSSIRACVPARGESDSEDD